MRPFAQKEFLFVSMVAMAIIFFGADLANQEEYPIIENRLYFIDILFIIIPLIVIILSVVLVIRHGTTGSHAISWIFFAAATISWFVAEQTYVYGNEYTANGFGDYISDFFYLLAYPIYFAFEMFYLKPISAKISKKLVVSVSLIAACLVAPTIYFVWNNPAENDVEFSINVIYPVLDGLLLAPAIISVALFFRGEISFLWSAITIGLIFQVIADTVYLFEEYNGWYYPGSLADLFFIWTYVLFAFGVFHHVKLFKLNRNAAKI